MKTSYRTVIIVTVCAIVLLGLIGIIIVLMNRAQSANHFDAYIDCQPPLSETEQAKCDKAEAEGYPYIVY